MMEYRLPELGEGVYEAELLEWKVGPGDSVEHGQVIAEVLTDKASMDLPAPFGGTIEALHAEPGQTLSIGDRILEYATATAGGTKTQSAGQARDGQGHTAAGQPRPAEGERPAPAEGECRAAVSVGATSGSGGRNGGPERFRGRAAPSVRRMARSLGIDLSKVRGSGKGGRILIDDVTAAVGQGPDAGRGTRDAAVDLELGEAGTRLPLQGLRRRIAEHMVRSVTTIPHYSYIDECDVTDLVALRRALKEGFAEKGIKLTYLAFAVKSVIEGLKRVPLANAMLDDESGEIVLHDQYHIGIATATPKGLVVPVIRHADERDIADLAREIERITRAAREGTAVAEDLRGSTFTITSIGNLGGLVSTPVINAPEVAILGLGRIIRRPIYDAQGGLQPADLLYLSFSFDHRVVDGAVGAVFGNTVKRALENPASLLVE